MRVHTRHRVSGLGSPHVMQWVRGSRVSRVGASLRAVR
jgi:hypothetical protein